MSSPMGMDFQIARSVEEEFDRVSLKIKEIIQGVIDNGQNMKQHWTGIASDFFDDNNRQWLQRATAMDAAFGGINQSLGEIRSNFQHNEAQVSNLFS